MKISWDCSCNIKNKRKPQTNLYEKIDISAMILVMLAVRSFRFCLFSFTFRCTLILDKQHVFFFFYCWMWNSSIWLSDVRKIKWWAKNSVLLNDGRKIWILFLAVRKFQNCCWMCEIFNTVVRCPKNSILLLNVRNIQYCC